MKNLLPRAAALGLCLSLASPATAQRAPMPLVDHHKHLISAAAARGSYPLPAAEVAVPPAVADLLRKRQAGWNNADALAALFTDDAVVMNSGDEDQPSWIRGRDKAGALLARLFGKPHRIKPVALKIDGNRATLAGYFHRPEIDRHFGHVLLALEQASDGSWRIAAESPSFPGPPGSSELNAETLIKELDEAKIDRAVVLSVAYWLGSAFQSAGGEAEYARVRAENDWVVSEVARYPDRLTGFCSVNPLKSYALAEVRRCGGDRRFRGLKLHFGNSDVDLRKPEHAAAVARLFGEANRLGLALIVHLWTGPEFEQEGGDHARALLQNVLPKAPDVTVQIAHMTGGGRATQSALAVLADAISANDPRTRNLYFDVATLVDGESTEGLEADVARMRQIGLERFLFGSDTAPPNPSARLSWAAFHGLPLTHAEFDIIAANVAPYLREPRR